MTATNEELLDFRTMSGLIILYKAVNYQLSPNSTLKTAAIAEGGGRPVGTYKSFILCLCKTFLGSGKSRLNERCRTSGLGQAEVNLRN